MKPTEYDTRAGHSSSSDQSRLGSTISFATLFVVAAISFVIQPFVGKRLLPTLGGSNGVWIAVQIFFLTTLPIGYGVAHWIAGTSTGRRYAGFGLSCLALIAAWQFTRFDPTNSLSIDLGTIRSPIQLLPNLLGYLSSFIGPAALTTAITPPLLQRLPAEIGSDRRSGYGGYRWSNAGSLVGLLAYPFLIEPSLTLSQQQSMIAFALLTSAMMIAIATFQIRLRQSRFQPMSIESASDDRSSTTALSSDRSNRQRSRANTVIVVREVFLNLAMSAAPVVVSLGATTAMTTDIAPMPMLWIIPLTIYLSTWIVAFTDFGVSLGRRLEKLAPLLAAIGALTASIPGNIVLAPIHALNVAAAGLICHARLYGRRPTIDRMTGFFLTLAVGGALGGWFSGVIAPLCFLTYAEYPLAIGVVLQISLRFNDIRSSFGASTSTKILSTRSGRAIDFAVLVGCLSALVVGRSIGQEAMMIGVAVAVGGITAALIPGPSLFRRGTLVVGAIVAICSISAIRNDQQIDVRRSFFGVHRVLESPTKTTETADGSRIQFGARRLVHGATTHGWASLDPSRRLEPLGYFRRTGPVGKLFAVADEIAGARTDRPTAVVGLGIGSMAAYSSLGRRIDFFEIDEAVVEIASDNGYFPFIRETIDSTAVFIGDGRRLLESRPDGRYGLIILDAFSSDSIPVHLLTREALDLYRRKSARDGMIAFQITNRSLDLAPALAMTGAESGLNCLALASNDSASASGSPTTTGDDVFVRYAVLVERSSRAFEKLIAVGFRVVPVDPRVRPWTDDYSSAWSIVRFQSQDR